MLIPRWLLQVRAQGIYSNKGLVHLWYSLASKDYSTEGHKVLYILLHNALLELWSGFSWWIARSEASLAFLCMHVLFTTLDWFRSHTTFSTRGKNHFWDPGTTWSRYQMWEPVKNTKGDRKFLSIFKLFYF